MTPPTSTTSPLPPLDIVIMAAGKGTRMKSALPKVLQRLAGWPLLGHVLDVSAALQPRRVVVVTGHGAAQVQAASTHGRYSFDFPLTFAHQEPQQGTGHAVQQAMPHLCDRLDGTVLVLSGDVPLTQAATLEALVQCVRTERPCLALLTVRLADPSGYGRIVRAEGQGEAEGAILGIVEHKDADSTQRAIDEIYSGIMAVPARLLAGWLQRLTHDNAQGEYYLTDIVAMAVAEGIPVVAHRCEDAVQVAGVNSPAQLAALERAYQQRQAYALLEQGVRLADPARFDLRADPRQPLRAALTCGPDVEIDLGCIFTGAVEIGAGARIGAYCCISNARIEAGAVIHPFTHIDGENIGASVGEGALIGPFARLRPGAQLGRNVHIGNFVEVKNSVLAEGAKANHLAYLGDAVVGEGVNYGAGSITANYDGARKHRTEIQAHAHIGSNCVLVAPVTIGTGSTVGAGSTITKDTPAQSLTVARGKQVSVSAAKWQRPSKTHP